jgi:hypothetical protein
MFKDDKVICPACGNQVDSGASACGFCGYMFEDGSSAETQAVTGGGRSGLGWIASVIILVVLAGVAVPVFFALRGVDEAFDSAPRIEFGGGVGESGKPPVELQGAYRNSRSFVADLRSSGIGCSNLDVATRNDFVEVATCYAKGHPVNMQIYFDPTALNGVLGAMGNFKNSNVVHKANWILQVPTDRRLARDIRKAIGGKLE